MTYRHAETLLNPHPSTIPAAHEIAAPLIGQIILAWTELQRDMARAIRDGRVIVARSPKVSRALSRKLACNFEEWRKLYLPDSGAEAEALGDKLENLRDVRDDLAHNVWTVGIDPELGLIVNRVRENGDVFEEFQKRQEKLRTGDTRNIPDHPRHFGWYCYAEDGLRRALNDMIEVRHQMLIARTGYHMIYDQ